MKEIKIIGSNINKIDSMIQEVEKKAKVRTLYAILLINSIDRMQKKFAVSKKQLEGIKVKIDVNAQEFPGAYKYTPVSTCAYVELRNGFWRLYNIERTVCSKHEYSVVLMPEETKKAILSKYMNF